MLAEHGLPHQAPPTQTSLRLAVHDDIDKLNTLISLSVRGLGVKDYSARQLESGLKYLFGVDTQLITDGTCYVIEGGSQLVACGAWSKRDTLYGSDQLATRQAAKLLNPATQPAKIRTFFVHPDWARRGLGSQLIRACQEAAVEAGFRRLELMATLTGEPLYARFGFETKAPTQLKLADGVMFPAVEMTKT